MSVAASVSSFLWAIAAAAGAIQLDSTFDVDAVNWVREPGQGSVTGRAALTLRDGTVMGCAGFAVELLPVATYSSERIFRTFGNNHAGQVLVENIPSKFTPDAPGYHKYVLKGACNPRGEFRFEKVPAGDYYVLVFIEWDAADTHPPAKTGGEVMKRIHVRPRENLTVDLADESP